MTDERRYSEAELQAAIVAAHLEGVATARAFALEVIERPEAQGRQKLALLLAVKYAPATIAEAIAMLEAAGREQPTLTLVVDNNARTA